MKLFLAALTILVLPIAPQAAVNKLEPRTYLSGRQVEVLPGKFIEIRRAGVTWELQKNSFGAIHTLPTGKAEFYQRDVEILSIPWKGEELYWLGVGIPITLRVHKDLVHLITFDRETNFKKIRFRYYVQDHGAFREIRASEFPSSIATQNMWLMTQNGFRNGKPVNPLDAALKLNPEDITFQESLTAKVWLQIAKGTEYYAAPYRVDMAFLKDFKKANAVVSLTAIQKKKSEKPASKNDNPDK